MLRAHILDAAAQAGRKTAKDLTRAVQHQAREAGWPTEAVGRVSVLHEDGSFTARFDGAEDWEYGTLERPPLGVCRAFNATSSDAASPIFEAHLADHLRGIL